MPDDQQQQSSNQHRANDDRREQANDADDGEARKRTDPRRRRTIRFVLLALFVVALLVAIPVYVYYSVRESTDDAQVDGHVIPVSSRLNGTIISVLVNDNQFVRASQELVRLDPAD